MARIKITYRGRVGRDGTAPIELSISQKGKTAYIGLGITIPPEQWDGTANQWVKGRNARTINQSIGGRLIQAQAELTRMDGISLMTAAEIRDRLLPDKDQETPETLADRMLRYMEGIKTEGTRKIYGRTLKEITAFDADMTMNGITPEWLTKFETWMKGKGNKVNTISIHLRNIRAVVKVALDEDIISKDPFRKFKIRSEPTEEQPMTLAQLRLVWHHPLEQWQEEWVALFKLCFYFIGINMADLSRLTQIDKDGYIRYKRAKTGRQYTIKVEKEAMDIIGKYRGEHHLLACFDRYADYRQANKHMINAIKAIAAPLVDNGSMKRLGRNHGPKKRNLKASPLADVQQYSTRRTWATIAYNECGLGMDVISLCLGHSDGMGLSVTQRYVRPEQSKIDDANRRVIDYLMGI